MSKYDVVILGSSPNALTAAAYLARAGKKVLVLESTKLIGGAYTTTEFAPGFRGDVSFMSGRIDPTIADDLKLEQHGLQVIEREYLTALNPGGKNLTLPKDPDAAMELIAPFNFPDAARYKKFMQLMHNATDFLRTVYGMSPPREHPPSEQEMQKLAKLTQRLRGYGRREMTEVMRLIVMSVRDLMDEWFETEELKGLIGSAGVRGLCEGPFAAATTFNLLHHVAIGDGFFRATALGGIGEMTNCLARAAHSHGAELRSAVGPMRIEVKDGVVGGVRIFGETIEAETIISDYDARYTFTSLVPPPELEPEFNRSVRRIRYAGCVARINLALKELPAFSGVPIEALSGTIVLSPSVNYMERAFDQAKHGNVSTAPVLEICIPSVSDPSYAPAGKHVMSVWFQYASYWSDMRPELVAGLVVQLLSQFAPNLNSIVENAQVIMPVDYEQQYQLTEGHLYGGEMNLAQAFFLRPVPGYSNYRTPIANLYLCGSAAHPGGGISGLSARNLVRELGVEDMVPA